MIRDERQEMVVIVVGRKWVRRRIVAGMLPFAKICFFVLAERRFPFRASPKDFLAPFSQ
jgi:hypothetical protein